MTLNYRIAWFLGMGLVMSLFSFQATASTEKITFEAEVNSSLLVPPMKSYTKKSALGGAYVASNKDNKGLVSYTVWAPQEGQYRLRARIKAPSGSKNSFEVAVNDGAKITWHIPTLKAYAWVEFKNTLYLTAGNNTLTVFAREAYTELDSLELQLVGTSFHACSFGTQTIAHGESTVAYLTENARAGEVCLSEVRTCNNGVLSGSYAYPQCVVNPANNPPPGNLDPALAPGRNFDLSRWKLTLPIDSSGGYTGTAVEIKPIGADYKHDSYFYTGPDGAMVFTAPVIGATTSGSRYPRSELREMTAAYEKAAWTVSEGGMLAATLAVNQLPTTRAGTAGRVIVGQIHGPDDELCRLYYDNGVLYFYDDKAGPNHKATKFVLTSSNGATTHIPLGATFSYTITVRNNVLSVTATHDGITYSASDPISSFWPGKSLYFKAGVYVQVGKEGSGAGTIGQGTGRASFYALERSP